MISQNPCWLVGFGALDECNKRSQIVFIELLPVCELARQFDWSKWVAISSLPPICTPSSTLMGGIGEKNQ